jgi:hypothetical protein
MPGCAGHDGRWDCRRGPRRPYTALARDRAAINPIAIAAVRVTGPWFARAKFRIPRAFRPVGAARSGLRAPRRQRHGAETHRPSLRFTIARRDAQVVRDTARDHAAGLSRALPGVSGGDDHARISPQREQFGDWIETSPSRCSFLSSNCEVNPSERWHQFNN